MKREKKVGEYVKLLDTCSLLVITLQVLGSPSTFENPKYLASNTVKKNTQNTNFTYWPQHYNTTTPLEPEFPSFCSAAKRLLLRVNSMIYIQGAFNG